MRYSITQLKEYTNLFVVEFTIHIFINIGYKLCDLLICHFLTFLKSIAVGFTWSRIANNRHKGEGEGRYQSLFTTIPCNEVAAWAGLTYWKPTMPKASSIDCNLYQPSYSGPTDTHYALLYIEYLYIVITYTHFIVTPLFKRSGNM